MKNIININKVNVYCSIHFITLACIVLLLLSCNSAEKDWNNAQKVNSILEYQNFIRVHSSGIYAEKAKIALDSLQWNKILKSNNVDSLLLFIKNQKYSSFLEKSKIALDSNDWNITNYSRDSIKLQKYSGLHQNNPNSKRFKKLTWEINLPLAILENAKSVIIYSKGSGIIHGHFAMSYEGPGMFGSPTPEEPAIYIWRDYSDDEKSQFTTLGISPGYAFLKPSSDKYLLLKKVDLNKNDKDICAEFGVVITK